MSRMVRIRNPHFFSILAILLILLFCLLLVLGNLGD